MELTPVILPPGRLRLATSPALTGSSPLLKTIGMVVVAALATSAAGVFATMTETPRSSSSAASAGRRSYLPSANLYSMAGSDLQRTQFL